MIARSTLACACWCAALLVLSTSSLRGEDAPVRIEEDGRIVLADREVAAGDWEKVAAELRGLVHAGSDRIVLRAAPRVPFSVVMRVMDLAREAGVKDVEVGAPESSTSTSAVPPERSIRIKLREGPAGPEILLLQETRLASVELLRAELGRIGPLPLIIDAEVEMPFATVGSVVEACRQAGVGRISFAGPAKAAQPVRVLYAENTPGWEFRYVRNLLERSAAFQVDVFLASADPGYPGSLRAFPTDLSKYDAILIGEIGALDDVRCAALREFVTRRGGGLVWMGPSDGVGEWLGNRLAEICPVRLKPEHVGGIPLAELQISSTGAAHPLAATIDASAWTGRVHAAWAAEFVDSDAVVLAEFRWGIREDRHPFLAAQAAGAGRVAYVAAEDTWRWREGTGDRPTFGPFWTAVLRWAAGRK